MLKSDLAVFHDRFEIVRRAGQDQEPERERGARTEPGAAGLSNLKHAS
jgi:hypothetical protein